jgi:hypothetical protein
VILNDRLNRIRTDMELGVITPEEAQRRAADARREIGGADG